MSIDDCWSFFLMVVILGSPIFLGAAWAGWFGAILGLLVTIIIITGISKSRRH